VSVQCAARDQCLDAVWQLGAREDVLAVAKQRAVPAAGAGTVHFKIVLAALELLVLARRLAIHVCLCLAGAATALDAVRVARGVDHRLALDVAFAIAGRLAARPALRGVAGALAFPVAAARALVEAVVLAGNTDAAVTLALALHGTTIGAVRLRGERAVRAADLVQLRGTSFLVDAQPVAATPALDAAAQFTGSVGNVFQAHVVALRNTGAGNLWQREHAAGAEHHAHK